MSATDNETTPPDRHTGRRGTVEAEFELSSIVCVDNYLVTLSIQSSIYEIVDLNLDAQLFKSRHYPSGFLVVITRHYPTIQQNIYRFQSPKVLGSGRRQPQQWRRHDFNVLTKAGEIENANRARKQADEKHGVQPGSSRLA